MQVTITFELDEEVTPDLFAQRVAEACFAYGAMRKGEAVLLPSNPRFAKLVLTDEPPYKD